MSDDGIAQRGHEPIGGGLQDETDLVGLDDRPWLIDVR